MFSIIRRYSHKNISILTTQKLQQFSSNAATGRLNGEMFNKVLIANRGEIAIRVMKTARRMGIRTVAVYSEADANAQHVKQADESYCIGPAASAESYLRGEKILEVAKKFNADCIHPGYGFLSENAGFAKLLHENNVEFLGPPTSAIVSMGSKSESKVIMINAGVPCTPGYHGEDQSMETLTKEAKNIGFPVMLKAVLGGGGKGMRIVENEETLIENIEACQREALRSFKDERILIEKYLRKPRHIELQIFADKHGNCVHLNERDCSVQRRHQKVLEESPAPGLSEALRKKMGDAAVAAAKAVGYVGAGTVEFMVDAESGQREIDIDSPFYFMEMNTRLQVEHPVTEMVTGLDLVEWQLRVGSGQELPITNQKDVPFFGHSIEARIYAESPGSGFLPGSGHIEHLHEPELEEVNYVYPTTEYENDLRVETGIVEGDDISIHYDPMISKVVVHAANRTTALKQLETALRNYRVVGVPTNIEFVLSCLNHPAFSHGGVDTSFIGKHEHELFTTPSTEDDKKASCAAIIIRSLLEYHNDRYNNNNNYLTSFGFRVGRPYTQDIELDLKTDDQPDPRRMKLKAIAGNHPNDNKLSLNFKFIDEENSESSTMMVQGQLNEDDLSVTIEMNGEIFKVVPLIDSKTNELVIFNACGGLFSNLLYRVNLVNNAVVSSEGGSGNGIAKAPMPGKIVKVFVEDGQTVEAGERLFVMEAMKMEHQIIAMKAGIVSSISCRMGDQVEDSKVLCKIVDNESDDN